MRDFFFLLRRCSSVNVNMEKLDFSVFLYLKVGNDI